MCDDRFKAKSSRTGKFYLKYSDRPKAKRKIRNETYNKASAPLQRATVLQQAKQSEIRAIRGSLRRPKAAEYICLSECKIKRMNKIERKLFIPVATRINWFIRGLVNNDGTQPRRDKNRQHARKKPPACVRKRKNSVDDRPKQE